MDSFEPGDQCPLPYLVTPPSEKVIIAAVTYFKYPANQPYRVLITVPVYEDVSYSDSLAKNAAAFFRISFSIRRRRFSSRSRLSSSTSPDWFPVPGKA